VILLRARYKYNQDSVVPLLNSLQLTQYSIFPGKRDNNSIGPNDNRNEYNCSALWLLYGSLY